MRNEFALAMIGLYDKYPNFIFLTGDLGFMAFEKLQKVYEERFVNCGVAEQNMVSAAAGMAYEGLLPWIYSIAPFTVLRPYEQIRNDVCMHALPVKIIGNGGGYGYGIMGATHHTLEDIAIMRVLPNMKVYVPLISSDVAEAVQIMATDASPNYLRLNYPAKLDQPIESFRQWRKLKSGSKAVVIGIGPILGNILSMVNDDVEVWAIGILPIKDLPQELISSINAKKRVLTIEEHNGQCGINELIARQLLEIGTGQIKYKSVYARGYPDGKVGSQKWLQEQSGLAGMELEKVLKELINDRSK